MTNPDNKPTVPEHEIRTLIELSKLEQFGISRVQRLHRCGYNFGAQMLTRWAEQGLVVNRSCDAKGWVFKPVIDAITELAFKAGILSLAPVEIERDNDGYWTHPNFPVMGENTTIKEADKWFSSSGLSICAKWFELEAPEDQVERFFDDGNINISDWVPQCEKPGAFLISIHDTEDGPLALFVFPLMNEKEAQA